MTDRISIVELRAKAERRGRRLMGDGNYSYATARWEDVLALVEAVEAAGNIDLRDVERGYSWWEAETNNADPDYEALDRLRTALDRFDFGDSA